MKKQLSVLMIVAVLGLVSGPAALADCKEDYREALDHIYADTETGLGMTMPFAMLSSSAVSNLGPAGVVLVTVGALGSTAYVMYEGITAASALEHGLRLIQQAEVGDGADLRSVLAELELDNTGGFKDVTIEKLATAVVESNHKRIFCSPKPISGKDIISIVKGQVRDLSQSPPSLLRK